MTHKLDEKFYKKIIYFDLIASVSSVFKRNIWMVKTM